MNDEIKKQLDDIKYAIDANDYYEIEGHFLKPLYDYITNLQQENEKLKVKYDNSKSHKINYKYFTTLYSKATKNIVIDDLVYKCEDLGNLRQSYEKLYIEKEDYKSRCEKAYEELTYMSSSDYVKDYDIKQNCWVKLSNILQGENNGN